MSKKNRIINYLSARTIKFKVIFSVLFVAFLIIVVSFTLIISWRITEFRMDLKDEMVLNAKLIGEYCVTPLLFEDHEGAINTLETLHSIPSVSKAVLFDEGGNIFAEYTGIDTINDILELPETPFAEFLNEYLVIYEPIVYDEIDYGNILIYVSTANLIQSIRTHLLVFLVVITGLLLMGYFLAKWVYRFISEPIFKLTEFTDKISNQGDYSQRIQKTVSDEIGLLYDRFNEMLDQIMNREKEKEKAERTIRENHEKLQLILENSPLGISHYDKDFRITTCNKGILDLFHVNEKDIIGVSINDFTDTKGMLRAIRRSANGEQSVYEGEFQSKLSDLRIIIRAIFTPLITENNTFTGGISIYEDITKKKSLESIIQSTVNLYSKATLMTLKELTDYAVEDIIKFTHSKFGLFYFVNEQEETIFLQSKAENPIKNYSIEIPKNQSLDDAGIWADCIRERKAHFINKYHGHPDIKVFPAGHYPVQRLMTMPIFDDDKIVAVIGVANKKTDYNELDLEMLSLYSENAWNSIMRKQTEEKLASLNKQLEERIRLRTEELELANLELGDSEKKFRDLSDMLPQSVFELNMSGELTYVNRIGLESTGYSLEDFEKGVNISQLVSQEEIIKMRRNMKLILKGADILMNEYSIIRKDGTKFPSLIYSSAIRKDRKTEGIRGVAIDITEIRKAEDKLQYRNNFEHLISTISSRFIAFKMQEMDREIDLSIEKIARFANADAGFVFLFNEDGNRYSMTNLWCVDDFKVIKDQFRDLEAASMPWLIDRLRNKKVANISSVIKMPDEAKREKELFLARGIQSIIELPLIYENRLIGMIGLHLMNSKRKWTKDETNLLKLAGQIFTNAIIRKRTQEQLMKATQEADAANQAKSEFLARMSHEIRTPMNAIIGMTHLVLQTELQLKQKDQLKKVHTSAYSLLGIINDILDFSKIEAGKIEIENVEFDIEKVFQDISNIISYRAHEKGLEIIMMVAKNLPHLLIGDSARLNQILLNLAYNAIKFTEKGEIVIKAELRKRKGDNAEVLFSVKDTGLGLTKEQTGKLFQSFSQADASTTRKYGGTGLGLVICKHLSELMGGNIWVESEFGKGSTFYFTVQMGVAKGWHRKKFKMPEELTNLRALVCDDNEISRVILKEALTMFSFRVTTVDSGRKAIKELEKADGVDPFGIVLMDWKMPGLDGLETSKLIIQNNSIPKTPTIIMVTAYHSEDVVKKADDLHLAGTLFKPVSYSTLFNSILEALTGKPVLRTKKTIDQLLQKEIHEHFQGAKILLVEDNEVNQEVAVGTLDMVHIRVDIANNGMEAIRKIKKSGIPSEYELVLMDLHMPIMNGYEATTEIRKLDEYKSLPILAMTADAIVGVKSRCLEVGMNDFLTKPINPAELYKTLKKWLPAKERSVITIEKEPAAETDSETIAEKNIIPNITGVDVDEGLGRIGGNTKLYLNLLTKFIKTYSKLSLELASLYDEGKLDDAERYVHTLKGVAGNIGAKELHIAAGTLNDKQKEKSDINIQEEIQILNEILDPMLESMSWVRDMQDKLHAKKLDDGDLDAENFRKSFKELSKLLESGNPESKIKFEEILKLPGIGVFSKELEKMNELMDEYNFNEALNELNDITSKLTRMSDGLKSL